MNVTKEYKVLLAEARDSWLQQVLTALDTALNPLGFERLKDPVRGRALSSEYRADVVYERSDASLIITAGTTGGLTIVLSRDNRVIQYPRDSTDKKLLDTDELATTINTWLRMKIQ